MKVIYATQGWGVHDDRWMGTLRSLGFAPVAVQRDGADAKSLRAQVLSLAEGSGLVLAGPLDSVAADLVCLPLRIVGLSWGYDIPAMADLSWLASLQGVVVDSESNRQAVEAAGIPHHKITLLPWGVELDAFTPKGPKRRPEGVPSDARVVLSMRAHEPEYRVDSVVDAFALMVRAGLDADSKGNVHLVVGHSGSMTNDLRRRCVREGVDNRVHFIGTVPEMDLPPLLRGSDCYVSASEVDGTSVTLLQAMACGTPVAVSAIDGNRSWVEHGRTGYLFEPGNIRQMSEALVAALAGTRTVPGALDRVRRNADWHANVIRLREVLRPG